MMVRDFLFHRSMGCSIMTAIHRTLSPIKQQNLDVSGHGNIVIQSGRDPLTTLGKSSCKCPYCGAAFSPEESQ